jgi:hypothetical protein
MCDACLPLQVVIMAAYVKAVKRLGSHPDPRTILDAYNNTPFSIAASRRHDAPLMMEVLNPATVIKDLQRIGRTQQGQVTPDGLAPPQQAPAPTSGSQAQQPQSQQQQQQQQGGQGTGTDGG